MKNKDNNYTFFFFLIIFSSTLGINFSAVSVFSGCSSTVGERTSSREASVLL